MIVKQHVTTEKTIDGYKFCIFPFGAWSAQRIGFGLKDILTRATGDAIPELVKALKTMGKENSLDMEVGAEMAAVIFKVLRDLNADAAENILKELLIKHGNITVTPVDTPGNTVKLDLSVSDTIFCGDLQNMYILAAHVILVNYASFFGKGASLFGELIDDIKIRMETA